MRGELNLNNNKIFLRFFITTINTVIFLNLFVLRLTFRLELQRREYQFTFPSSQVTTRTSQNITRYYGQQTSRLHHCHRVNGDCSSWTAVWANIVDEPGEAWMKRSLIAAIMKVFVSKLKGHWRMLTSRYFTLRW